MKFSAKQRKAIYAFVPAIIALLVAFNVVSTAQIREIISTFGLAAGGLTSLLAYSNTDSMQDVDANTSDESIGGTDADN